MANEDERRHSQDQQLGEIIAMARSNATSLVEIKTMLTTLYVTKEEFFPVKSMVYGTACLMLVAVFTALASLVIHHG